MQRVWLDTEFVRNNLTPRGLISIALTSESGKEYYAVNWLMDTTMYGLDSQSYDWMCRNVWPHLPGGLPEQLNRDHPDVKQYETIREEIDQFFWELSPNKDADEDILIYVNRGAQDMIRLHTLWDNDWGPGAMPGWIPTFARDMADVKRSSNVDRDLMPRQDQLMAHHALYDARHEKDTVLFLEEHAKGGVR